MQLFYYDKNMQYWEKQKTFRKVIEYLEQDNSFSEQKFATQLTYSWYLYAEGEFLNQSVSNDWEFFKNKWIEKLNIAIAKYKNFPTICLVVAYTLNMNGMDIYESLSYEKEYKEFYKLCEEISSNPYLTNIAKYLSSNRKIKLNDNTLKIVFPNDSILDNYFKQVLK